MTVMLLALTQPSRSEDLSKLDLRMTSFKGNGGNTVKARETDTKFSFFFPSFPERPELCLVQALRAYEKETAEIRKEESRLLLALIKPHKAVVS